MQIDPVAQTDSTAASVAESVLTRARERLLSVDAHLSCELERAVLASDFVLDALVHDSQLRSDPWNLETSPFEVIDPLADEAAVMSGLRRARRRELARIAIRDISGQVTTAQTLADLSALADAAIQSALMHAVRLLATRFGDARDADATE